MIRTSPERGSAIVIAMIVMTLILATALGSLQFIDRSQRRSGDERVQETAFNYGEALLNNQVLQLARRWPATAAAAAPASCSAAGASCPDPSQLSLGFAGTDVSATTSWKTSIRDNLGSAATYYSKAATDSAACGGLVPCTWDSNGDGAVWVRAEATVAGKTRALVSLVRQQQSRIALPRNVITADRFATNNNGNKTIVDEKGCQAKQRPAANCNATDSAPITVRCTTSTPGTTSDPCLGYRSAQVAPNNVSQGYPGNVLPATTLLQMKTYAIQLGSYYTSCPSAAQLSGPMVFIDGASCSYTTGTFNSAAAPGFVAVNAGTISLGGSTNFYGVIYAANNLPSPQDAGNIVSLTGGAYLQGAIFAEGRGGVFTGASGVNVSFDPNAISNIQVASTPSLVQNSFRELLRGQ